jgi:hypothetical protein
MVGSGNDDDSRLRRYGSEDVLRDVCGRLVCPGRRADHRPPRARHRQQLLSLLLAQPSKCSLWLCSQVPIYIQIMLHRAPLSLSLSLSFTTLSGVILECEMSEDEMAPRASHSHT